MARRRSRSPRNKPAVRTSTRSRLISAIEKTRGLYPRMQARVIAAAVTDQDGEASFAVAEEQTGRSHLDPISADLGDREDARSLSAHASPRDRRRRHRPGWRGVVRGRRGTNRPFAPRPDLG